MGKNQQQKAGKIESPERIPSLVGLLKACGKKKNLSNGTKLHADILERGLSKTNSYVASALVSMYVRCGMLAKAHEVLEELPVRDIVSWNALIVGYAQQGHGYKALDCFKLLQSEGISPNDVTFASILKACGSTNSIEKGKEIHGEVVHRGLFQKNIVLQNALIDMYAKCGVLAKAEEVLQGLPIRNEVSWSALITGFARDGRGYEAIDCFMQMQREGLTADEVTFTSVLKACGSIKQIHKGKQIHNEIVSSGFVTKNIVLGNALVDMYSKCGVLTEAQKALEFLPVRDIISWSTLIAGYGQHGYGDQALNCYDRMQNEGISPNEVTFICILNACGSIGAFNKGRKIHDEIVRCGLLERNIMIGNALVDMYAKCGKLKLAKQILQELPGRDLVSWNALIAGYTHGEQGHEALDCFVQMQNEDICPDEFTFTCILKACGRIKALDKGREVHEDIINRGMLTKNIVLGNALVDMYAKCGALIKARQVFEDLPVRDVISWNALISGYMQNEQGHEAFTCFLRMQKEGLSPDEVTFTCILKACGSMRAFEKGQRCHNTIANTGFLEKNIVIGNALVDMYAKCGVLKKAQEVLECLPVRNVVSWNSLISGYVEHEQDREAFDCYAQMQEEGVSANEITFICILKACGNLGAIDNGKQMHDQILDGCWLDKNIAVGTALVDMYAKCGELTKAEKVLEELPLRDVVAWSTLITGYTQEGQGDKALKSFVQMQREGFSPDEVVFLCILNACGHNGLFNEIQRYYESMDVEYGMAPKLEHHTCMVVVFSCTGHFDNAMLLINTMPTSHDPSVWLALLGACRKWGNVHIGRLAFDQAIRLNSNLGGAYAIMTSIYASAGMLENAEEVESMRLKNTAQKSGWLS